MRILSILFITLLFFGCVKEEEFGLSDFGRIKSIALRNQAKAPVISQDDQSITVEMPIGIELDSIYIDELLLSSFATSSKNVGDHLDLNNTSSIEVTSESGKVTTWAVIANIASSTPQVENGDFELWYQTTDGYLEPGESAESTIWGTGNPGTFIINVVSTVREQTASGNYAAKMTTEDNGSFAIFGTPISAGTIYTGRFNTDNLNPSDPTAAIDFGTPFVGRPRAVSFDYTYQPGDENKDKDQNILPFPDSCDVYALLEIRTGDNVKRLATAWFRSSDATNGITNQQLDFTYGPLDSSFPEYMKDANFVSADSAANILPTHLTFVATSSYNGANFAGAVGSTLELDNVIMIYEE